MTGLKTSYIVKVTVCTCLYISVKSVCVVLYDTDIDEGTVRTIHTSPRVTVTGDDGERD